MAGSLRRARAAPFSRVLRARRSAPARSLALKALVARWRGVRQSPSLTKVSKEAASDGFGAAAAAWVGCSEDILMVVMLMLMVMRLWPVK